jgi:VWFA-related protein
MRTRRREYRTTAVTRAAAILVPCVLGLLVLGGRPAAQQATFRSGVELVWVDATVVDNDGRPVTGLTGEDFDVSVDGKRRRVASAQFVNLSGSTTTAVATLARPALSSNEIDPASPLPPPDRLVVIAVDHSSFLPGRGRQVVQGATRFLDRLDPSDRVALVSYPEPGLFIPPTTDRAAIKAAFGRIIGTGEAILPMNQSISVGLTEAIEIASGDLMAADRVVSRECRTAGVTIGGGAAADSEECRSNVMSEVPHMVGELRARTTRSLNALVNVLNGLQGIAGRKTLVLLTAGLAASPDRPAMDMMAEMRALAQKAALSDTTLNVLHVDSSLSDAFGADRRRAPINLQADADLMANGLELMVNLNGGGLFRVPAASDAAFGRVMREMSAFYVLGIESETADKDGKPHTISVKVRGRSATIRHRQLLIVNTVAANQASPDESIAAVLRSGQTVRELPMHVSTRTLRDVTANKLRVLVRADVGRGAAAPAMVRVGLAYYSATGQNIGSSIRLRELEPTQGLENAWGFQDVVALPAGDYTVRVVARDSDGVTGSVIHPFTAGLTKGTGVDVSDLLVIDGDPAGRLQLSTMIGERVRGERLSVFTEVYPEAGAHVTGVTFAMTPRGADAPLGHVAAVLSTPGPDNRISAQADFDGRALPAGDYTLSASVLDGETTLGRVSRPVTVVRAAAGGSGNVVMPSAGAKPFDARAILGRDVLSYFSTRLKIEDPAASSPAVAEAERVAMAGEFSGVLRALGTSASESLSGRYYAGLGYLATGNAAQAAEQFRQALKASPRFMPAMFYLGACEASVGRDSAAVEAWRAALLSARDARVVYVELAEAYLRLQDPAQAVSVLTNAQQRWPQDEVVARRLADARLMAAPR